MQVWLITGASRGFGLELARQALESGDAVVATVRRPEVIRDALGDLAASDRLAAAALDVTDAAAARRVTEEARARFGRIDMLVNNAGRGMLGAVEEVSDAETRATYEVNVFGVLAVTRAVLPVLRAQGSGHIVMMSSMGGFSSRGGGWGIYSSTKFAVEGFSEALAHELRPLGIAVTLVEPGVFRTDFLDGSSLQVARATIDAYAPTAGRTRSSALERNHTQQGDPVRAAAAIRAIAGRPDAPLRLPLGEDALAAIEGKIAAVEENLDAVRDLSLSTGYR